MGPGVAEIDREAVAGRVAKGELGGVVSSAYAWTSAGTALNGCVNREELDN